MTNPIEALRSQQELNEDPTDTIVEHIKAALQEVHTALPGVVQSYNLLQQTVKVQPTIKRLMVDGTSVAIKTCLDVPVIFPGGALTFDIAAGDECLLVFAERCVDRWWSNGGVQEPAEIRFHDISDGFAFMGVSSLTKLLEAIGSGTELRLRDGSCRIAIKPDGRVLLGSTTAEGMELTPALNGVVLAGGIDPFTKLPYYLLGGTSQTVLAKK